MFFQTKTIAVWATTLALNVHWSSAGELAKDGSFDSGIFAREQGINLNKFADALGNIAGPPPDFSTASNRACGMQQIECARAANRVPKPNFQVSDCDDQRGLPKTSSPTSTDSSRRASAQANIRITAPRQVSPPSSPLSSTSTVDDGDSSSPILPPLQVPQLPERAQGFLRTPPPRSASGIDDEGQYVTTSWGSPYPQAESQHLRRLSFSSSEASDELPLLQLEIDTPYLRPAPETPVSAPAQAPTSTSLSGSAAVLANRARRPLGGITEEWIRQHTAVDPSSEQALWFSDGPDDSEHSSLSGSVLSDEAGWLDENESATPRPSHHTQSLHPIVARRPRARSSIETLTQSSLDRVAANTPENMDSPAVESSVQEAASSHTSESNSAAPPRPATPVESELPQANGSANGVVGEETAQPSTPAKPTKTVLSQTPRVKKKVPWKGKNILVLLPHDEERGQPGKAPMPLDAASTEAMLQSWKELGYSIEGFDLDDVFTSDNTSGSNSRSREEWPSNDDMANERSLRQYQVTLPDLNAWKEYVNELAEAKLRALGVTFAEEEPEQLPSISPVPSSMSRQASNQFPAFPFSPPIPTPSSASNGGQGFPFAAPFLPGGPSVSQSPAVPAAVASPVSFAGQSRFNSRASISFSPHEFANMHGQPSPLGWSPQLLLQQQQLGHAGSPSMVNMMSPVSPFSPDGISPPVGLHQRHQSLQYPMLPHQFLQRQDSARQSPRLQEVLEDDEEETRTNPYDQSPAKTPEPEHFIRHNASNSLQKEIDEAEYHLEEQFRSQLEHEDYSPHNEVGPVRTQVPVGGFGSIETMHARGPSVHFSGIGTDSDDGPKLHHPQPHSRGHSLSQNPFFDNDEVRDSTDEGSIRKPPSQVADGARRDNSYEVQTNPSNIGTPAQSFEFGNHQRVQSIGSKPWVGSSSQTASTVHSRQASHTSKPSFTKLNAGAAEFKFNPTSNFVPGQFVFSGKNSQAAPLTPTAYQASTFTPVLPKSTASSHFSVPSTGSSVMGRINPAAPVFTPHKSEFSFSSSGPKFNPDAKAFQPKTSVAPSIASIGASAHESGDNLPKPIFNGIDLNSSEFSQTAKKSKAVPIVRPSSRHSPGPAAQTLDASADEERKDGGRTKKQFRDGDNADGDEVPRFAPTPEADVLPTVEDATTPAKSDATENVEDDVEDAKTEIIEEEDDHAHVADTTMASTVISESTDGKVPSESNDTKATTSPSAMSPDVETTNWEAINFTKETDVADLNNVKTFGEPECTPLEVQKPHFSAAAKPFVPGGLTFGGSQLANTPFQPDFTVPPKPMRVFEESEDDHTGSPTPGPEHPQAAVTEAEGTRNTASPERQAATAKGLLSSRFASPPPAPRGLKASRFASSPPESPKAAEEVDSAQHGSPPSVSGEQLEPADDVEQVADAHTYEPLPVSPPSDAGAQSLDPTSRELTFEEIDAVMADMNLNDPTMGVKRTLEVSTWRNGSPVRSNAVTSRANSPPVRLQQQIPSRSDGPSPSPRPYVTSPEELIHPKPPTDLEDPFVDPPHSALSRSFDGPVHRLNIGDGLPESDWDEAFSGSEQSKFEHRISYFDGHVNELVDNVLASRLHPLEDTLHSIQDVLAKLSQRAPSTRRDRRSFSAEVQESDADDEDDEFPVRHSLSPKRDRKLEQIRNAVIDALSHHQTSAFAVAQPEPVQDSKEESAVIQALEEMKLQITASMPTFPGEDIRARVEEAVKSHIPPPPPPVIEDDTEANKKFAEMQSRIHELEERLRGEESRSAAERSRVQELEEKLRVDEARVESEIASRRAAEDRTAELRRHLEQAETKVEVEIMNRSIFDQRVHDLEDRLKAQEGKTDVELSGRREAEDRLSEIQRLLRISSEEEDRLRAVVEERDQKIKMLEQTSGKTSMRLTLLEAAQANAEQTQAELKNRLNAADAELRDARQETRRWRAEAEQARDAAARQTNDFRQSMDENKHLRKLIDTLGVQLEEHERIRDNWRAKFVSLQDDMAHAAREITEENSRRTKKEQALIARQEVLDARLQAEARTRERLEVEVERLENGERAGMRAVSECKRLETLLAELRTENHNLHQQALRSQREAQEARDAASSEMLRSQLEIQEARDSAAADVQRAHKEVEEAKQLAAVEIQKVRESVTAELEAAYDRTNIVKADFEEEVARLRAELDQVRLEADTAKAHHEMMLEEAQNTKDEQFEAIKDAKDAEIADVSRKHQNELEDLQTHHERQINKVTEDAQRTEQNLLERLSLSSSKIEHLQDRVAHLEEKVQIAQEAARAAAQAGAAQASKSVAMPEPTSHPGPVGQTKQLAQAIDLPEKISPQALRESIMVLQEQLQAREQRIEELEQKVADLDPDAATKIAKRDDEITWLRELLAVRHGDLQDIIGALSAERYDREAVKDAAIRLKANLQMEEQERERAMNGGSALNLPNIAATISKAATPRVAQAVGPLAAAWGSWRKATQSQSLSAAATQSPAHRRDSTPSKSNLVSSRNGLRSGLMTPPTSGIRTTPLAEPTQTRQPTAFGNTGRRFTAEEFANRNRGSSLTTRQAENVPIASTPPPRQERSEPRTPPMMQSNSYDDDARMGEFDDASFFDD
ncbi:hypothetical protein F5Y17DRAFT_457865 [Xylariaceae sp. FL0594]|nr:hypothetical protein F5Y17DRAFT_457865 [Xylariaceae sp. FL0594]